MIICEKKLCCREAETVLCGRHYCTAHAISELVGYINAHEVDKVEVQTPEEFKLENET